MNIKQIIWLSSTLFLNLQIGAMDDPKKERAKQELISFLHNPGNEQLFTSMKELTKNFTDINAPEQLHGQNALIRATSMNNVELAKLLIDAGAAIDAKDYVHSTPLMYAVLGKINLVKLLLAAGANVNLLDNIGQSPLMLAIYYEHPDSEIIKLLINSGANINAQTNVGTPLIYAVNMQEVEIVKLLLNAGANVNIPVNGLTPLHVAVINNNIGLVQLLLEHGAYPEVPNILNQTALDLAREGGNKQIIKLLQDWIAVYQKKKL